MAEEGSGGSGAYKPLDFYVGVVDLFSILLPGAILAFLAWLCIPWSSPSLALVSRALSDRFAGYAAFAVIAYVLGHFLSALGSSTLDHVYDRWYKKFFGHKLDRRRKQVKPILIRTVGADRYDNALDWSLAVLKIRAPGTFAPLDRLEADSKFFRSITVVLLVAWPVLLYLRQRSWTLEAVCALISVLLFLSLQAADKPLHEEIRERSRVAKYVHTLLQWSPVVWIVALAIGAAILLGLGFYGFAGIGAACCVPALISAERYMALRIKRTQLAYELVTVVLDTRSEFHVEENVPPLGEASKSPPVPAGAGIIV